MRDDDRLLDVPEPEFGSGVVGVCDICGERQAVVILQKERYKLCVLDFLNKTWLKSDKHPGVPAPLYRSDRVWFPTEAAPGGRAPAIVLTPTKAIRHPVVLITPDTFGITTTLLDAAIRFAREGFEVLLPDLGKTDGFGVGRHLALRAGRALRGGLPARSPSVTSLVALYRDALRYLLSREMVDTSRSAVFGVSYGGTLALAVAAESTTLTAAAAAYPVRVAPASFLSLITAPLLVVRGSADREAERAEEQIRSSPAAATTSVVTIPGLRHDFLSRDLGAYDLAGAERAWTEVVEFLKQRLMPAPPSPPPPPTKPMASPAFSPTPTAAAGAALPKPSA